MSGGGYSVGGIELLHLAGGTAPDDVLRSLGYQMAKFVLYTDARVALHEKSQKDLVIPARDEWHKTMKHSSLSSKLLTS